MKRCAQMPNNSEYSLCGDAWDAPDTECDVEPFRFVERGETVTCSKCREIIDKIKQSFPKGYKLK